MDAQARRPALPPAAQRAQDRVSDLARPAAGTADQSGTGRTVHGGGKPLGAVPRSGQRPDVHRDPRSVRASPGDGCDVDRRRARMPEPRPAGCPRPGLLGRARLARTHRGRQADLPGVCRAGHPGRPERPGDTGRAPLRAVRQSRLRGTVDVRDARFSRRPDRRRRVQHGHPRRRLHTRSARRRGPGATSHRGRRGTVSGSSRRRAHGPYRSPTTAASSSVTART